MRGSSNSGRASSNNSDNDRRLCDALLCAPSSDRWLEAALADTETLLLDHAECEKKAAGSALSLVYRYPNEAALIQQASRFAREELRHFEMVHAFMRARGIEWRLLTPSRYAGGLKQWVRNAEPHRLLDTLLVAAIIEARSLERFVRIVEAADDAELAQFYGRLRTSEARHARTYLALANRHASAVQISSRMASLREIEQALIDAPDDLLRFHSGTPSWDVARARSGARLA